MLDTIEFEFAEAKNKTRRAPTQQAAAAQAKLGKRERLLHKVVGSELKAAQPNFRFMTGGENENG